MKYNLFCLSISTSVSLSDTHQSLSLPTHMTLPHFLSLLLSHYLPLPSSLFFFSSSFSPISPPAAAGRHPFLTAGTKPRLAGKSASGCEAGPLEKEQGSTRQHRKHSQALIRERETGERQGKSMLFWSGQTQENLPAAQWDGLRFLTLRGGLG